MAHCSVWSNATSASRKNCKTTFPKCSLCSRTRASFEMTSDHSCASMPKSTTSCQRRVACLWVVTVATISCSPNHCYDGISRMDLLWITCTKSSSTNRSLASDGLESRYPQLDARATPTPTKLSSPTRLNYSAIRAMGRRSPTSIATEMSSTARRLARRRSSTTSGSDNWTSSPTTRTK